MGKPIDEMTLAEVAAAIHEAVHKVNLLSARAMGELGGGVAVMPTPVLLRLGREVGRLDAEVVRGRFEVPAELAAEIHEAVHKVNLLTARAMGELGGVVKVEGVEKGYYAGRAEAVPEVRGEVYEGGVRLRVV